jgi:hypothetical protein
MRNVLRAVAFLCSGYFIFNFSEKKEASKCASANCNVSRDLDFAFDSLSDAKFQWDTCNTGE